LPERIFLNVALSFAQEPIMRPTEVEQLSDQFLQTMLESTFSLQQGPDREVNLRALIQAAEMLKIRFEQELAELRSEDD